MRVKKTRQDQRNVYRYPVDVEDGRGGYRIIYNVIKPGENGVTEVMIKSLHAMDDHEVYNNTKNGHPPITAERKVAKKEWEEAHPGKKYDMNWNLSMDYLAIGWEHADKSNALADAFYDPFAEEEVSDEVQKLRDIVASMTNKQKQVYQHVFMEERSLTEVAKIMKCSPANVKQISNKVISLIKAGF